jgi:hypothetical protein
VCRTSYPAIVFQWYTNDIVVYFERHRWIFNVCLIYLNVFSIYFNAFEKNVFWGYSKVCRRYINIFALCTYLRTCISLTTTTSFPTHSTCHLFFCFHWFILTFIQSMEVLHINSYSYYLYIILYSAFHIITNWVKYSGAQA